MNVKCLVYTVLLVTVLRVLTIVYTFDVPDKGFRQTHVQIPAGWVVVVKPPKSPALSFLTCTMGIKTPAFWLFIMN